MAKARQRGGQEAGVERRKKRTICFLNIIGNMHCNYKCRLYNELQRILPRREITGVNVSKQHVEPVPKMNGQLTAACATGSRCLRPASTANPWRRPAAAYCSTERPRRRCGFCERSGSSRERGRSGQECRQAAQECWS